MRAGHSVWPTLENDIHYAAIMRWQVDSVNFMQPVDCTDGREHGLWLVPDVQPSAVAS